MFHNGTEFQFIERNGVRYFTRASAPVISVFDVSPHYLRDTDQPVGGNLIVSGNISGATNSCVLTEVLGDGTKRVIASNITGSGAFSLGTGGAPAQNAEFILDAVNLAGDTNQARKTFYRWITPTVSISAAPPVSHQIGVNTRVLIVLTLQRTGNPLPTLSLTSSAGTHTTQNPNRNIGNGLSVSYNLWRTVQAGDSVLNDTLTLTGRSSLPITTVPAELTATHSVAVQWPAG